ncbi:hypothetical protein QZH41_014860, partial [Actinostola sp. cb2023]
MEDEICKLDNGHYQMPLPLKSDRISLPYNHHLAEKRWRQLNSRFKKNPQFLQEYKTFMKDVVDLCAEKVPTERLDVRDGKVNYVPHTGVYHHKKPGQIRVVFDCSARYEGVSLNDCLLQGPDLLNSLLGVLCRFREEKIAFMVDVKSMFHQLYVSEQHRDLLRFLWWEDGDQDKDVVEYRMKVHLFGAASFPGCANFGLKRAADDGEEEFGTQAAAFIRDDFYVDDGLKSTPTVSEAINLIESSKAICAKAGMRLHKLTCNSKEVLQAIHIEDRSKNIREIDLKVDPLPIERALGVVCRFSHISNWFKAKKAVALCIRLLAKFRRREIKADDKTNTEVSRPLQVTPMTPSLLQEAEKVIIRCVQSEYFQDELQVLRSLGANREKVDRSSVRKKKQTLKKTSSIYKLDPFIDQDGLVRVGGRIGNADVPEEVRHPVILPRKCHVTTLLIRSLHKKVNHMGRSTTHNELRQCGYWILGASAAVSNVISQCVTCRRQRRPLEQQKMSSLPKDRVEQVPPFSYSAVDYFGPFVIKERRSELKRYGVLFTCLLSRGVHLETANSLDTSSFINALRRFLARRGPVRQIRCDQGTNFVGARNELKAALTEMDEIRVSEYLLEQG